MKVLNEKVIKRSNKKALLNILPGIIYIIIGVWLLTPNAESVAKLIDYHKPMMLHFMGAVIILVSCLALIFSFRKIGDVKINSEGIFDNSRPFSVGKIYWSDIVSIDQGLIRGGKKILAIKVKDPNKYLNNISRSGKMFSKAAIAKFGTPVIISADALSVDFDQLMDIIQTYYKNYQTS